MVHSSRAQSATEFVVIFLFLIILLFAFLMSGQSRVKEISVETNYQVMQETSDAIIAELDTARQMTGEFEREFFIKELPDYGLMKIELVDPQELVVRFHDLELVEFLNFPVYGEVFYGVNSNKNTVFKTDGILRFPNGTLTNNESLAGIYLNVHPGLCLVHNLTDTCPVLEAKYGVHITKNCEEFTDFSCS